MAKFILYSKLCAEFIGDANGTFNAFTNSVTVREKYDCD